LEPVSWKGRQDNDPTVSMSGFPGIQYGDITVTSLEYVKFELNVPAETARMFCRVLAGL